MTIPKENETNETQPRNLIVEVIGTAVSMVAGAFVGFLLQGNGLGFVAMIVLCSVIGWILWLRRRQHVVVTIGLCLLLFIAFLPVATALRELD